MTHEALNPQLHFKNPMSKEELEIYGFSDFKVNIENPPHPKDNPMSQTQTILTMLRSGWVTPLSATKQLHYCNFGARMTEIRHALAKSDKEKLLSMWITLANGKRIRQHKIVRVKNE